MKWTAALLAFLLPLSANAGKLGAAVFVGDYGTECVSGCDATFADDNGGWGVIANITGGDSVRAGGELLLFDKGGAGIGLSLAGDVGPFSLTAGYGVFSEKAEYTFPTRQFPTMTSDSSTYWRADIAHRRSGVFAGYMRWDPDLHFRDPGVGTFAAAFRRELVMLGWRGSLDF